MLLGRDWLCYYLPSSEESEIVSTCLGGSMLFSCCSGGGGALACWVVREIYLAGFWTQKCELAPKRRDVASSSVGDAGPLYFFHKHCDTHTTGLLPKQAKCSPKLVL